MGKAGSGSLVIALPKIWAKAHDLLEGSDVIVAFDDYEFLKVIPQVYEDGRAALGIGNLVDKKGGANYDRPSSA